MTQTTKKKPDFSSLDLSKITATEAGIPTGGKAVPAAVEGLEPTTKKSIEGAWIMGKDVHDVTSEEFRGWLKGLQVPDVDKLKDSDMSTPAQRERLIQRVADFFNAIDFRSERKREKKFVN